MNSKITPAQAKFGVPHAKARIYKDYVGRYEWRPGTTDNIIVKDGKLWSQMGGETNVCLPVERPFSSKMTSGASHFPVILGAT